MKEKTKLKPKAGYVYVVTNECLKLVEAKGAFKGRMVKAVKIGNAKDFTNRLGSLNTAVYENFDLHLSIRTDNVIALEGAIQDVLQDYRIFTQEKNRTEFFACPIEEVIRRVKQHSKRGFIANIEKMVEYKGGKRLGRSGVNIRSNIKKHETAKARVEKPTQNNTERAKADKKRVGAKDAAQGSRQRASASTFEVLFSDGTLIRLPTARDVFVEAIEKFGIGRVAKLGFKSFIAKDINLLGVGAKGAAKIGNWYVSTHSSTDAKIKRIESIAKKLGERVEVNKI